MVQNPEKTVGNMLGGHRDADAMNWAMFFFSSSTPNPNFRTMFHLGGNAAKVHQNRPTPTPLAVDVPPNLLDFDRARRARVVL